jgi:hypothetical protein
MLFIVRTTGHGIASAMARIGGFITPFIADSEVLSVAHVCGIYGVSLFMTSLASYGLPNDRSVLDDPTQELDIDTNNSLCMTEQTHRMLLEKDNHGDNEGMCGDPGVNDDDDEHRPGKDSPTKRTMAIEMVALAHAASPRKTDR